MEDTVSHSSVDSALDEFVLVHAEPKLHITGNGGFGELEQKLSEVLSDDSNNLNTPSSGPVKMAVSSSVAAAASNAVDADIVVDPLSEPDVDTSSQKAAEKTPSVSGDAEAKPDSVKEITPAKLVDTNSYNNMNVEGCTGLPNDGGGGKQLIPELMTGSRMSLEGECTVFTGVTYLGSAAVNAPRSETEINRNMAIFNDQSQMAIPVTLSVPSHSEGIVYLLDPNTSSEISSYPIHRILFCARGPADSNERRCFAFTSSHGDSAELAIFQCHVFSCDGQDVNVAKILYCFATAFRRVPKSPSIMSETGVLGDHTFHFSVALEFKEMDAKGNFVACPKDKNVFKLRCNVEKKICIVVTQSNQSRELKIERCFGLLISPGRNVKDADMHLIDMVSMGIGSDQRSYVISANWDPTDPSTKILNTETPKDTRVFMTVAVDLVIEGIQEPVRFLIETRAKIFPTNERFWYFSTKPHVEQFVLKLKEFEDANGSTNKGQMQYEVVSIESRTEADRKKTFSLSFPAVSLSTPSDLSSPADAEAEESDGDEPLQSGSGIVSKDVTDENLLDSWRDVMARWHQNLKQRPKQVQSLVRKGIPEALRGEVWQLLAGCTDNTEMLEEYRILIAKDSPSEQVILRDINRTFPANDYFKESGGLGQDALYKISKAYSVYDEDINYCQGVSFLAASLLLHMPEEQAFCVLVKIMFEYGLRDLFRHSFEALHLKFYQLERLMQEQVPDLFDHFMDLGLEAHMYASQWFLTLFTAKFPLFMVFHILDLFLSEGMETIFSVALALLKTSRKELLALDFEGVLKFFRVQLPKKYRSEESAKELLQLAVSLKVSPKKLKKFEKDYIAFKEAQMQQEDPFDRLQRENKRLLDANMRLEQENDDLAHELVTSKITLRKDLDEAEDKCDILSKELLQTRAQLLDTEDELKRLEIESQQLKEVCRRELDRSEAENTRNQAITSDYKQICSQLSERLEKQQTAHKEELNRMKLLLQNCENCSKLVTPEGHLRKIDIGQFTADIDPNVLEKERIIRELELELAQTKLALVESECKNQDLVHQLNSAMVELQTSKSTWFQKTLTSFKEVTAKVNKDNKDGKEMARKDSLN